jgi:hypothetical protein
MGANHAVRPDRLHGREQEVPLSSGSVEQRDFPKASAPGMTCQLKAGWRAVAIRVEKITEIGFCSLKNTTFAAWGRDFLTMARVYLRLKLSGIRDGCQGYELNIREG